LRDPQGLYWDDAQLINDINQARADVVRDCLCTRVLATVTLNQGQEAYPYSTVLSAVQNAGYPASDILEIFGLYILWGTNIKRAMDYLPFEDLNAAMRVMPQFQSIPVNWSFMGQHTFYVAPIPNQAYSCDVSCAYLPNALANYTDAETAITNPFIDAVPIKAARYAKYYERSFEEANAFEAVYMQEMVEKLAVQPAFRVPTRYAPNRLI
jgi:hypothetical protein